jgi:hypothetical protein
MANIQLPNLPAAITAQRIDPVETVQAGVSVRITAGQIADLANNVPRALTADFATLADRSLTSDLALAANTVPATGVSIPGGFQWPQSTIPEFPVARTIYVTMTGNDANDGTSLTKPKATINAALTALATSGSTGIVIVHPGDYVVQPDTEIPTNCALYGYDLRVTNLSLPSGQEVNNMFLMTSGIKVRGFSFRGLKHDAYSLDPVTEVATPPTKGFAFVFKPGAIITRSPYIADCSQLHTFTQDQMVLPIDRANANEIFTAEAGYGGGNILADGSALSENSPLKSVVVDSFTAINPNGVGYLISRDAFVQLVSVFTNWSRVGIWTHQGGHVTMANSNSTFGDYSLVSTDFRVIINAPALPAALEYAEAADEIASNTDAIVDEAMASYALLPNWNDLTETQKEQTRRDTRTLLRQLSYDLESGQSRASEYFVQKLVNWDGQLVWAGTVTPTFTELTNLFIACWAQLVTVTNTYITDPDARGRLSQLVGMIDTVTTATAFSEFPSENPYAQIFSSLIEANNQQLSYAGAGINYNSLPVAQGGTGESFPLSTLVKLNGGRIYATFSTENGDTYLGPDLRVDFERSTIEGQAFSRGVQNIALPLIIALGG